MFLFAFMVKMKKFPETKYEDLKAYAVELSSIYLSNIYGRKIVSALGDVTNEEIYKNLRKNVDDLNGKYEEKLNKNDFYSFDSLNDLEKFLFDYFPKGDVEKSVSMEVQRVSKAIDRDLDDIKIGCWLCVDSHDKMNYLLSTSIGFNDENNVCNNIEDLV